jgi:4-hydroxyacetophenone monooxygenase
VELVAEAVARLRGNAIVTEAGARCEADVVIFATGFHTTRVFWPMDVIGRNGVSIHDAWHGDDPRAHLGITVPGYPNLFVLLGPQTGLGHGGSVIFHIEAQVRYAIECIARMVRNDVGALEPDPGVTAAYVARVDAAHERMVFSHPGMSNWYKNRAGRVVVLSPWRLVDYWAMTRTPDFDDFVLEPRAAA